MIKILIYLEATSIDRLGTSGYKSNVTGFGIGTNFEYLDDLRFGLATRNTIEKISVDSSASDRQKQEGNYFDSFIGLDFFMTKEIKSIKQQVVFLVIIV